ncbi:hypothetical protein NADFUDRAFT_63961 [Nadsonia fulvescens var. elongata DSM 6958]|uniref:Kinetochore protein SPC25 n=1 Tax=Nadsonia fulvescens var. elongata DSM 6958 TaxID=857566 RepID=A0A1E3PT84_9ASCO|nr:hypothetical protein NADFUDRAFT_63961 [Nadsonia fulvescens var. elongata DSM 6958]
MSVQPTTPSRLSGVMSIAPDLAMPVSIPLLDFNHIQQSEFEFSRALEQSFAVKRQNALRERAESSSQIKDIEDARQNTMLRKNLLEEKMRTLIEAGHNKKLELEQSRDAIANYNARKSELVKKYDQLQSEISEVVSRIGKRKEVLASQKQTYIHQISLVEPEILMWENTLGLTIDTTVEGQLEFIFWNIDQSDLERKFEITIDISGAETKALKTNPALEKNIVDGILTDFNKTEKLEVFLTCLRAEFVKLTLH